MLVSRVNSVPKIVEEICTLTVKEELDIGVGKTGSEQEFCCFYSYRVSGPKFQLRVGCVQFKNLTCLRAEELGGNSVSDEAASTFGIMEDSHWFIVRDAQTPSSLTVTVGCSEWGVFGFSVIPCERDFFPVFAIILTLPGDNHILNNMRRGGGE